MGSCSPAFRIEFSHWYWLSTQQIATGGGVPDRLRKVYQCVFTLIGAAASTPSASLPLNEIIPLAHGSQQAANGAIILSWLPAGLPINGLVH